MRDGSMFRHLQDYDTREFWKNNPYFYIYTVDGRILKYHIYNLSLHLVYKLPENSSVLFVFLP